MSPPETLEDRWRTAAADLSLDIQIPFELILPSGAKVKARVLLKNFGAENGMLIVSDYDVISDVWEQIVDQGYGFSTIDDPSPNEEYNREVIIEVLEDWTWSGPSNEKPVWLRE